jgi:hypothetical protein
MIPALPIGPVSGPGAWVVARSLYRRRGKNWLAIVAVAGSRKDARADLKQLRVDYGRSRLVIFKLVKA